MKMSGISKCVSKQRIYDFVMDIGAIGHDKVEGQSTKGVPISVRVAVPKDSDFEKKMAARTSELSHGAQDTVSTRKSTLAVVERNGVAVSPPDGGFPFEHEFRLGGMAWSSAYAAERRGKFPSTDAKMSEPPEKRQKRDAPVTAGRRPDYTYMQQVNFGTPLGTPLPGQISAALQERVRS